MDRERYSISGSVAQNCLAVSAAETSERLKPVPIGSRKTRSVKPSQVPGLSLSVAGSEGLSPSLPKARCLGPMAPKLRYTDEAPGPPLTANVTGRSAPGTVYAV